MEGELLGLTPEQKAMQGTLQHVMEELLDSTARELLVRVKSGTATAQEMTVAINLLKMNGVSMAPAKENPLGELMKELPNFNKAATDARFQ